MISYFAGKKNMNMDSDANFILCFLVHFFSDLLQIVNPKSIWKEKNVKSQLALSPNFRIPSIGCCDTEPQ